MSLIYFLILCKIFYYTGVLPSGDNIITIITGKILKLCRVYGVQLCNFLINLENQFLNVLLKLKSSGSNKME